MYGCLVASHHVSVGVGVEGIDGQVNRRAASSLERLVLIRRRYLLLIKLHGYKRIVGRCVFIPINVGEEGRIVQLKVVVCVFHVLW